MILASNEEVADLEALEQPTMEENLQPYAPICNVDFGHHVEHIFAYKTCNHMSPSVRIS